LRPHHHAGDAIAALRRLLLNEGALQRPGIFHRAKPLDGLDRLALHARHRRDAGEMRFTVDHHGASPALTKTAAKFGAVHLQVVPQHIEQRRARIGIHLLRFAIDGQLDHALLPAIYWF
jgi:hypothetical protein